MVGSKAALWDEWSVATRGNPWVVPRDWKTVGRWVYLTVAVTVVQLAEWRVEGKVALSASRKVFGSADRMGG